MIAALSRPPADSDIHDLAALLMDAVEAGASVSFLDDLTFERAEQWWRETLASADERAIVLVARDEQGITGTVQLHPIWAPNQPHRADVAKLLVHRRARRRGVAKQLMQELESHAALSGFTLLTLDTKRGDAAEGLYRGLGWVEVGVIPDYALNPDGSFCDTVIFYRRIR